ncbi:MAG: phage head closure protein [Microcoleaceae cyanobacterium]
MIQLVQITNSQNSNGRTTETIANRYNLWATLVKQGSGRQVGTGQTQLQNTLQFKIYWRTTFDISGNWRLIWAGRQYTVSGIDRDGEQKFHYLITATSSNKS